MWQKFKKGDVVVFNNESDRIHQRRYFVTGFSSDGNGILLKTIQFEDGEEWGIRLNISPKHAIIVGNAEKEKGLSTKPNLHDRI